MHASAPADVEQVLAELRRIPRGGPKPKRLATLHNLRDLSRVDGTVKPKEVGTEMCAWLRRNIKTTRITEVGGNPINPAISQLCLELILGYKGGWLSLPERRYRVLCALRIPFSVEQMRRPHSPEWELLRRLAEHLVSTAR